ncbi:MAG: hypothetical protein A2Z25_11140 [Planctomycetes bacterium RBG_16_55_9]|nr:MAG: hypothetical protein A2Z25_11140 [Planctomycetes bacterium RBG_16_55_9]
MFGLFRLVIIAIMLTAMAEANTPGQTRSEPKPVPRMQVVPMPYDQASFQRDGVEITRYHFGSGLHRPFLFPIIGASGRSLTRMGHPHDPESHSHHNSVWISHNAINGTDFWSDRGGGKIHHRRIIEYEDADEYACLVAENEWISKDGTILLLETRQVTVLPLPDAEWLLVIDLEFKANKKTVTLGKTPFGMIACGWPRPSASTTAAGQFATPKEQSTKKKSSGNKPNGWITPERSQTRK